MPRIWGAKDIAARIAAALGLEHPPSRSTIERWERDGLPLHRIHRRVFATVAEIDAWCDKLTHHGASRGNVGHQSS